MKVTIKLAYKGEGKKKAIEEARNLYEKLLQMTDDEYREFARQYEKGITYIPDDRVEFLENYMVCIYDDKEHEDDYLFDDWDDLPEVVIVE